MGQLALFPSRSPYPDGLPGHAHAETSREAAEAVAVTLLTRQLIVQADLILHGPSTPDEVAARLRWPVHAVRPRFTELAAQGRIEYTGERRPTPYGATARVWRAVEAR